jgi:PRTRC genetic system protein B
MAPYWNCYDNGSVCTGTMKIPTAKNAAIVIRQWEDSFFNSAFSHAAGISKHTSYPGGVLALWKSLQGKKRFPLRYLLPVDESVGQFVSTHDTTYRNQHRA